MNNRSVGLDPEDDLLAFEQSTFSTFIDDSQKTTLLELWRRKEKADNDAFFREFCGGTDD